MTPSSFFRWLNWEWMTWFLGQAISLGILWVLSWKSTNGCECCNYNLQPLILQYVAWLLSHPPALWSLPSLWGYFLISQKLSSGHTSLWLLSSLSMKMSYFDHKFLSSEGERILGEKCQINFKSIFKTPCLHILNLCAVLQNIPHKMMHVQVLGSFWWIQL